MMKKCFYRSLVLITLLSCFALDAVAQNISVEAKLDQPTIRIGDQTNLRLIVNLPVK